MVAETMDTPPAENATDRQVAEPAVAHIRAVTECLIRDELEGAGVPDGMKSPATVAKPVHRVQPTPVSLARLDIEHDLILSVQQEVVVDDSVVAVS